MEITTVNAPKLAGRLIAGCMAKATTLNPNAPHSPPSAPPVKKLMTPRAFNHPLANAWQRKWVALEVTHPRLQKLGDAAESFCSRWVNQDPVLLYLCGPTGTGKSHVARAILRFCRASASRASRTRMLSSAAWRWPELADEFKAKNFSALDDVFTTDLAIIDDIGAEDDPFNVAADKLCQILSRREKKFTVITSNKAPEEFAAIDPRIADRMFRNSKIVDLAGVTSFAELNMSKNF